MVSIETEILKFSGKLQVQQGIIEMNRGNIDNGRLLRERGEVKIKIAEARKHLAKVIEEIDRNKQKGKFI